MSESGGSGERGINRGSEGSEGSEGSVVVVKRCAVTGHRDIPIGMVEYVKARLREEVRRAIDEGYTAFLSGMADGADILFADVVLGFKDGGAGITLEACIPYRERLDTPNADFQRIIAQCDAVTVCAEEYSRDCYMRRNRYMVDRAELVIAVYDGREIGGTAATMGYARKLGREVRLIEYEPK